MRTRNVVTLAAIAGVALFGAIRLASRGAVTDADACLAVRKSHERVLCLRPLILEIAKRESPKRAIEVAYDYQTKGVIAECHLLAHAVGEDVYKRQYPDVPTAFASCSDKCVQGCYHGVMSELLSKGIAKDTLTKSIRTLCAPVRADSISYKQCVHGIGHGLLTHNRFTQREAIQLCTAMGTPFDADACLDGVFMENMFPFLTLPESAVKARLPEACGEVIASGDAELIAKCLFEVADGLMFYTDYDLDRALGLCDGLRQAEPVQICKESVRTWKRLQLMQAERSRIGR